jgi:hypothetical protein
MPMFAVLDALLQIQGLGVLEASKEMFLINDLESFLRSLLQEAYKVLWSASALSLSLSLYIYIYTHTHTHTHPM